jgi:hypothetical protein
LTSARPRLVAPLAFVGFLVLVLDRIGYSFAGSASTVLIVRIQEALDPASYAGDWFLSQPKVYHQNFINLFATLARAIPLEALFLAGQALTYACVLLALYRLTRILFPERREAFFLGVALLVTWGSAGLGNNVLIWTHFTASGLASGIAFLGLAEFVAGRDMRASLLLGVATIFHLLVGGIPMLYIATILLFSLRKPAGFRNAALCALAFLIPAMLSVGPILRFRGALPMPISAEEYVRLFARIRNPHHYIPSSWEPTLWVHFFFPFLLAIPAWVRARRGGPHARVHAILAAMAFWCVIGTVFVEWIPQREITQLQLFRLTYVARALATIAAAVYLLDRESTARWPAAFLILLLVAGSGHTLMIPAALILLGTDSLEPRRVRIALLAAGAALAAAGFAGLAGAPVPRPLAFKASDFTQPALPFAVLAATRFVLTLLRRSTPAVAATPRSTRLAWGAVAALVAASVVHAGQHGPTSRFRATLASSVPEELGDWVRACEWIRRETPPGTLFVTPPYRDGFHLLARRPEVADFKSNPYTDAAIVEWKERIEDLAGGGELSCEGFAECIPFLKERYNTLDATQLAAVGAKYAAWGCVTERDVAGLDAVHREGEVVIYRFDSEAAQALPPRASE